MNLAYTDRITVDTSGVLITRGETAGSGVIPNDIEIRAIAIKPETSTDVYWIKGTHADANWVKESSVFSLEGLASDSWNMFYVKSNSGSIVMNLHVKGR